LIEAISNDSELSLVKTYSDLNKIYSDSYFKNISKEISNDTSQIVVISTPPESHFGLYKYFQHIDKIFVIEKPLSINYLEVKEMFKISKNNNNLMVEGLMIFYHPYIKIISKIFEEEKIVEIISSFTIPMPKDNNFRANGSKSSGGMLDTGIYVLGLLSFLGSYEINNFATTNNGSFDLSGEILANTKNGEFIGNWGFGEYTNYLEIKTKDKTYYFDFFYSKPNGYKHTYTVKDGINILEKKDYSEVNQFAEMYKELFNNKDNKQYWIDNSLTTLKRWVLFDKLTNKQY
tara:strand:- start:5374 stop:6240 length:867 start_codon:yes stop_codon:yes gene_type:complete